MRELSSERRDASKAGLPQRDRKLELAAHAAWLYYIAENTQEEIAASLNVSREAAQHLVALAVCAATHLEAYLVAKTPTQERFHPRRTLRGVVDQGENFHPSCHASRGFQFFSSYYSNFR